MKKIISVLMSVLIIVCGFSFTGISAYAAYVGSVETTSKKFNANVTVNGFNSIHGTYEIVEDEDYYARVEFVYDGEDPLDYWEIKDLQEGVDYVILYQDDNKLIIGIINKDIDYVEANAVTKTTETTSQNETTTKANTDNKSPDTGAVSGAAFASTAIACGVAMLCSTKKRK